MRYARRAIAAVTINALAERRGMTDGFGFVVSPKFSADTTAAAVPRIQARFRVRPRDITDASRLRATREAMPKKHERFLAGGAEDLAEWLSRDESSIADASGDIGVFYNRVGAINRDVSVLIANVFAEERLKERRARKDRKRRPPSTGTDFPKGGAETGHGIGIDGMGVGVIGTEEEGDEEEEGLDVLDAFSASGVRAMR